MAQRRIARGQHRKQRLVDGADANLGKQRAAAVVGQPIGTTWCVFLRGTVFTQLTPSGRQGRAPMRQRQIGRRAEHAPHDVASPVEHGVGRGHGGQGKEDAAPLACQQHALGQQQRGFGLARAGFVLDESQSGAIVQIDLSASRLHGTRVEVEQALTGRGADAHPRLVHGFVGQTAGTRHIVGRGQARRQRRKPFGVGADPVGGSGQPRQPPRELEKLLLVEAGQRGIRPQCGIGLNQRGTVLQRLFAAGVQQLVVVTPFPRRRSAVVAGNGGVQAPAL